MIHYYNLFSLLHHNVVRMALQFGDCVLWIVLKQYIPFSGVFRFKDFEYG